MSHVDVQAAAASSVILDASSLVPCNKTNPHGMKVDVEVDVFVVRACVRGEDEDPDGHLPVLGSGHLMLQQTRHNWIGLDWTRLDWNGHPDGHHRLFAPALNEAPSLFLTRPVLLVLLALLLQLETVHRHPLQPKTRRPKLCLVCSTYSLTNTDHDVRLRQTNFTDHPILPISLPTMTRSGSQACSVHTRAPIAYESPHAARPFPSLPPQALEQPKSQARPTTPHSRSNASHSLVTYPCSIDRQSQSRPHFCPSSYSNSYTDRLTAGRHISAGQNIRPSSWTPIAYRDLTQGN